MTTLRLLRKRSARQSRAHHPDLHPGDPDAPERFRQIIAANAFLRDAKQRATYDRLLQLERQQFQWTLERQQLRSQLERQQLRLKMMCITVAVTAVGALVGGYGLFAPISTTGIVEIEKDNHPANTGAAVNKDRQTATIVAANENENTSAPIAPAKADAVKGDSASEPVETVAALLMQPASPADQGELRRKHDSSEVRNGVIKPRTSTSETNSGDASDIADRELALGPLSKNSNFYRQQGIASYRDGDFPQAVVNFNAAIRLDPDDAQAYNIRGNAWDEMGLFKRALADYDEAIRIDPNNPAVFRDRAILWHRKGALDEALLDLDRAIRFSFSDVNMYCDRGLVWYQKSQHNRAIADFNQAIKLDPTFAAAYLNRGLILHRNKEFNAAFAAVYPAIHVDPKIFDVNRHANMWP